jgi:hypothetical protein
VSVLPEQALIPLTREDGLYEYLGASFFLIASIVFLITFIKTQDRNIIFMLFALAFFFAAGEEISWGQRILNFDTPEVIETINAQKEFTFHNLDFIQHSGGMGSSIKEILFNFNRLFILFWMVFCILIPLANRISPKLRKLFLRIRMPIISIWFGMLFIINEITSKALEIFVVVCKESCPEIYEIKESAWGLVVLLMAIYFISPLLSPELGELPRPVRPQSVWKKN